MPRSDIEPCVAVYIYVLNAQVKTEKEVLLSGDEWSHCVVGLEVRDCKGN